MEQLREREFVPTKEDEKPMRKDEAASYLKEVPGWSMGDEQPLRIRRQLEFEDFQKAMGFVNRVADLAEAVDHHPDLRISYNEVTLELYTHTIGGLHQNDFIMAARINAL